MRFDVTTGNTLRNTDSSCVSGNWDLNNRTKRGVRVDAVSLLAHNQFTSLGVGHWIGYQIQYRNS